MHTLELVEIEHRRTGRAQRQHDLRGSGHVRESERPWKHANDRARVFLVEVDCAPDRPRVRVETLSPKLIREKRNQRTVRVIICGREIATQLWRNSEDGQEIGGNHCTRNA